MKLGDIEIPAELYERVREILDRAGLSGKPAITGPVVNSPRQTVPALQTPWLTRDEAAEYAKCSVRHIDSLAQRGEVKRYAGPRYLKDDIDKCIKQGRFTEGPRNPNPTFGRVGESHSPTVGRPANNNNGSSDKDQQQQSRQGNE